MTEVAADLASRGARLEYWFIKLYVGDLAFLVDYIVRLPIEQAEVRVSLWVGDTGRVMHSTTTSWRIGSGITIGDDVLDDRGCSGVVEDVEWNLFYRVEGSRVAPRVPGFSRLKPFDLDIVIRPRVVFSGHVTVAGQRFDVDETYGTLTHYWGRRLPDRWQWISAGAIDGTGTAVEGMELRTKLWGIGPGIPIGYLWTREGERESTLISPLNGLISRSGALTDYLFIGRRPAGVTRLRSAAAPTDYNDLGEGIHQTLLGTCVVGEGGSELRAGLEYRIAPP